MLRRLVLMLSLIISTHHHAFAGCGDELLSPKDKFAIGMSAERKWIDSILPIKLASTIPSQMNLAAAMNYSLNAGGKRIRPYLFVITGKSLGIDKAKIIPLLRAIEHFHTASLIFDDLPAQDNAAMRRGRPTSHQQYPEYLSQMAGISLIAEGFRSISELNQNFEPNLVVSVYEYCSTQLGVSGLSTGQVIDLDAERSNHIFTLDELKQRTFYKTTLAIEASIVPVLILAKQSVEKIELWKKLAYEIGLIFQMTDDVLDTTSNSSETGKDAAKDSFNFVTLLGVEGVKREIKLSQLRAYKILEQLPEAVIEFRGLMDYLVDRKK